jgi:hypothetical protein
LRFLKLPHLIQLKSAKGIDYLEIRGFIETAAMEASGLRNRDSDATGCQPHELQGWATG